MYYIIKFYIRNLFLKKSTSFITIVGFALSMSVALILTAFIISEKSYDKSFENHKRIFRLVNNEGNKAEEEEGVREKLEEKLPQVEMMCNFDCNGGEVIYNDKKNESVFVITNESFFKMFTVPIIAGRQEGFFEEKNSVVITQSYAKKVFGDINPMGETIDISHGHLYKITAICADLPQNSSIRADYFISGRDRFSGSSYSNGEKQSWMDELFFLEKEGININDHKKSISKLIYAQKIFRNDNKEESEIEKLYQFQPLDDIYFNTLQTRDKLEHANVKLINLMTWIAIVIYALAIFNYVNLTTAVGADRLKEIGVRKTIGAGNGNIFTQVIIESFITCSISFVMAYALSFLISPIFEEILGKEIGLNTIYTSTIILLSTVGSIFATGLISGIYPSLAAISFSPKAALQKTRAGFNDAFFRQSLNVIQFTISIALIICVMVIMKQIDFVKHKDLGFNSEQLIRFYIHGEINSNKDYFLNELKANPNIANITLTSGCPGDIWSYYGNDMMENVNAISSDIDFAKTFKLEFLAGSDFNENSPDGEIIINETFKKLADWESINNKSFMGRNVIGMVKDFHLSNMKDKIAPMMIMKSSDYVAHATVRLTGNISETMKFIENTFKEMEPTYDFEYSFYDDWFAKMYQQEENYAKTVRIFGILAILISCLGLFGLAEFSIKKRTKEIGVRKVTGAKTADILSTLNNNFLIWVFIAFLIACTLGWYFMNKWLEGFAFKTSISWWVFALAGILALGVAFFTVSWRSFMAARRNPVEALRYE